MSAPVRMRPGLRNAATPGTRKIYPAGGDYRQLIVMPLRHFRNTSPETGNLGPGRPGAHGVLMREALSFFITVELHMRRFAAVGAGLLSVAVFSGAAHAADLPAPPYTKAPVIAAPVYDWASLYIGLNGGGAASHECWTIFSVAGAPVFPNSEGCHSATGGLVGGQIGYRGQVTSWVFGIEAQGDWARLTGSNPSLTAIIPYTNQTRINGIGLFTGQVGYAWNNVLWYVKGGAAVTDNKYNSFFSGTNVVFNQANEARWGGAVGTGVEFAIAPNWSTGVEYNHLFMGNKAVTFPASTIAVTRSDNIREDVDMLTLRVNCRFGGKY
jgi:outer membrane immunogenic protein